jgi:hypothetical protein
VSFQGGARDGEDGNKDSPRASAMMNEGKGQVALLASAKKIQLSLQLFSAFSIGTHTPM